MRTIRSLTSLVACAVVVLVASSASAAWYTFVGRLTTNRGHASNVPMAGVQTCGSLTLVTGPQGAKPAQFMIVRGVNTQPNMLFTPGFNWKTGMDQGCVPAVRPLQTTGMGIVPGAGFTLPPKAFHMPYPKTRHPAHYMFKTDIPVVEVKNFAPAVQLATSVSITAAPPVRARYGGTQGTMGMLGGAAKHAPFRRFMKSAWKGGPAATFNGQTGRAAAAFNWCPPPLTNLGGAAGEPGCGPLHPDIKAKVTYTGGGNAFGGTMSMVTHQVGGVGSLGLIVGPLAFNNFGGGNSVATGRGYADYNMITIPSGNLHMTFTIMTRYIGPILGNQKVVGMVNPANNGTFLGMTMWPAGLVYSWGFPWTTMTIVEVARNAMSTKTTTITAKGWDCAGTAQGPACSKTMAKGVPAGANRNISLVSGGLGIARLPVLGDNPIADIGNMQLLVMPEPGAALQRLAGVIGLLGIAAWRWRRVR